LLVPLFPPGAGLAVGKALLDYLPQPLSQDVARYLVAALGALATMSTLGWLGRLLGDRSSTPQTNGDGVGGTPRTQSTVGRPEVTAWVLSALLQAGGDEERTATAVQRCVEELDPECGNGTTKSGPSG